MSDKRERRQHAERRGRRAEALCLWCLRLKGYRILARGYRVPSGEIDILARRGAILAAIEVKARGSRIAASEAISSRQRSRITRALSHFLARRPDLARLGLRFDVMLVTPGRLPHHLRDAWRPEEN